MEGIKRFLSISYGSGYSSGYGYGSGSGSGDGCSNGSGDGYGSGSGDGYGYGYGYGSGSGDGYGYGYGYGSGDGIKQYNRKDVYIVDDIQTIIDSIHGNFAKGFILNDDLTLTACYIAKVGNYFAHGETLHKAMSDAQRKYNTNKPLDERIADFIKQYPTLDTRADNSDLFRWHNTLTGSCEMGRKSFCNNKGVDYQEGKTSIRDFIALCKDAYGGENIKLLEEQYIQLTN